jgi:Zinc-binding dehydrogenase
MPRGETPQLFSALSGLYGFDVARAERQTARELAEQRLTLAPRQHAPAHLLKAHGVLGGARPGWERVPRPACTGSRSGPCTTPDSTAPRPCRMARPQGSKFSQRIKELTDGRGVDVVFDCVGAAVWDENLNSLPPGGRLVITGSPSRRAVP